MPLVGCWIALAERPEARCQQVGTVNGPETEDGMNPYTTHELVNIHQRELIDEADHARLAKEARLASRGNGVPARRPLIWLREAPGGFAAWLMALTGAQARNF